MKDDFVSRPVGELLNRDNYVSRVKKLERKAGAAPSARLNNLAEMSNDFIGGRFVAVDANAGVVRMVMAGEDQFDLYGVHAHFLGFSDAGIVQVYLNAADGKIYAGGGIAIMDASGFSIEVSGLGGLSDAGTYHFSSGIVANVGGMGMYMSGGDAPVLKLRSDSDAVGGGKGAEIFIEAVGDAGDIGQIRIKSFTEATENGQLRVSSEAVSIRSSGSETLINNFPYTSGETVFNEQGSDIDFRIESDTDTSMFILDAGLSAIGIGGAVTSGYALAVTGKVKVSSDLDINTNKFNVVGASGNTTVAGTLGVTGLLTASAQVILDRTSLTIASGVITATTSYHTVDTQAAAATDDLDTINGASTGALLVLRAVNGARTVVVKNGTGNITLAGSDFSLDNTLDRLFLLGDTTNWIEIARSNNGA